MSLKISMILMRLTNHLRMTAEQLRRDSLAGNRFDKIHKIHNCCRTILTELFKIEFSCCVIFCLLVQSALCGSKLMADIAIINSLRIRISAAYAEHSLEKFSCTMRQSRL
ncbi:MAG: hypothetical protein LBC74_03795 [Planctomycetaceae bacterium]|nr:hypothetical protein [Planctomycetaceae bacterium]